MYKNGPYSISRKALYLAIYIFAFLFLALYGKQGFQTLNQIILWGFGPILSFYILEPNINKLNTIPGEYYLYLSMIFFAFIGYVNVKDDALFFRYLQVFIANFVLMIVVYFGINNLKEWTLAWKMIGLVGCIVAFMGYFVEVPADTAIDESFRLTGITGNANGTANYARLAITAGLIILQLTEKKYQKILIWILISFLSYTILLTASRGSFGNLVLMLVGYLIFRYFKGWRIILLLALLFIFGSILLYAAENFLSGFYLYERLTRNDSVAGAIDDESRLQIYTTAWNLFLDHPFFGVGLNQFRLYSGGAITHTDILDILVQLGTFAGITYILIYVKLFRRISRLKKFIISKKDERIYQILLLSFFCEIFFGLGNPNWFTQMEMIVLSLMVVYAAKIKTTGEGSA